MCANASPTLWNYGQQSYGTQNILMLTSLSCPGVCVCVCGEIIMINDIISAYSASNFNNLRDMKSRLLLSHFSLTSRSISDMSRNWCECEKGKLQQHMIWWAVDDSIILRHMFITKNTWKQHHVRVFIFQRGRTTLYIHTPGIMWCQQ